MPVENRLNAVIPEDCDQFQDLTNWRPFAILAAGLVPVLHPVGVAEPVFPPFRAHCFFLPGSFKGAA